MRRRGSGASSRSTSSSSSGGIPAINCEGGTSSRAILPPTGWNTLVPSGRMPVSDSYIMQPSANRSARGSRRSPRACSGAMYAVVPARAASTASASRLRSCWISHTRPKSMMTGRPLSRMNTFDGFRSRWTNPSPWMYASGSHRRRNRVRVLARSPSKATLDRRVAGAAEVPLPNDVRGVLESAVGVAVAFSTEGTIVDGCEASGAPVGPTSRVTACSSAPSVLPTSSSIAYQGRPSAMPPSRMRTTPLCRRRCSTVTSRRMLAK